MMRKHIVVGDSPACGGTVLQFECFPPTHIDGCQVALIGGRVLCAVCNTVGHIAKAGGPYRPAYSTAENALEGDMVVCECPVPSVLVSTLGGRWSCDDRGDFAGEFDALKLPKNWYRPNTQELTSNKENVNSIVKYLDGSYKTICPGQTDQEFFIEVFALRDRAIQLINRKIGQLIRWDDVVKADVFEWFGQSNQKIRDFLMSGLNRTINALKGLTKSNFVRYSDDFEQRITCAIDRSVVASAAVCKSDIRNRIIGIAIGYCELRKDSGGQDSKLGTLIHEITHFEDIFNTDDPCYGLRPSIVYAKAVNSTPQRNADSIVGYVMWETNFDIK